jgi:hypothetical protein
MKSAKKSASVRASSARSSSDVHAHVAALQSVGRECERLRRELPVGRALTREDRRTSSGRFRDGEAAALHRLLDLVDARPHLFSSLAAHDGGSDRRVIETAPTRDALARKQAADEALASAELLVKALRDYALVAGEEVRSLTTAAHAIVRASAVVDASLRDDASAITEFYRGTRRPKPKSKPA